MGVSPHVIAIKNLCAAKPCGKKARDSGKRYNACHPYPTQLACARGCPSSFRSSFRGLELSELMPSELMELMPSELTELMPSELMELMPSELTELMPSELTELMSVCRALGVPALILTGGG